MTPYESYMSQVKEAGFAADMTGLYHTVKGYAQNAAKAVPKTVAGGVDAVTDAIKTHGPKVLDALHGTAKATGSARVIQENLPHLMEGAGEAIDAIKGHLGVKKKLPSWVLPAGIGAGGVALGSMAMGAMHDQNH